jgi:hypothetical protein
MWSKRSLALIACAIISIYLFFYFASPKIIVLLQTSLADFTFDMLLEKQPIVIHDRIVDTNDIIPLWFPYNKRHEFALAAPMAPAETGELAWNRNGYKYAFVHCTAPGEVILSKTLMADGAPDPSETLAAIQLEPRQSIILPYRVYYSIAGGGSVKIIGIDDIITALWPRPK